MPRAIKRVPLVGVYNTRAADVNALSSTSGIVGVGVIGSMVIGQAAVSSDKDQRFVNCFPLTVTNEIAQTRTVYLVKRPGFVEHNVPSSGDIGTAIHVWSGQGSGNKIITAFGDTNSEIFDGVSSLGSITGVATGITETILSGTANICITSDDNTGWYYEDAGTLTKISDADFPGNNSKTLAGTFAHLDGYAFVMDTEGAIWASNLNSLTGWTVTDYINANAYPDQGVGLIRHRNTIVALGRESFEVFRNAGNPAGSPLARIEELSQLIGCISADAIASIQDTVYWAGSTKQGVVSIYAYNGGQAKRVSNPEVDIQLVLAGASNISMTTTSFYGRHFVIVKASNTTWAYCVEEGNWHEWSSQTPLWYKSDSVSSGSTMVSYFVSNVATGGKVYVFNPASISYTDDGVSYSAVARTSKLDFGTARTKHWHRIAVIGDRETEESNLTVTWSDDDYQTSSTARTIDLSDERTELTRCGSSVRRSFTFTHTSNTPMRLEAIEAEFSVR